MRKRVEHLLTAPREISAAVRELDLDRKPPALLAKDAEQTPEDVFDQLQIDNNIRAVSLSLFRDRHYARAVEEAYKCIDNFVKNRAKSKNSGASLMQHVFSPNKPLLKLNPMKTESHQNEQLGYMQILAGCMTGIRNPRAHEHKLKDSPERALDLIVLASHLMKKLKRTRRPR